VTYAAAFAFGKPKTNNGGRGREYLRDDNKRGRRRGRADTPDATALGNGGASIHNPRAGSAARLRTARRADTNRPCLRLDLLEGA